MPQVVSREILEEAGRADAICFASPSAVESYVEQAVSAATPLPGLVVCIGPVTAAAARARGLNVAAEASEHTVDGLLAALAGVLGRRKERP